MCTHIKRIGITFTATLMLALAVGTATARNLSTSEQSLRVVFTPIVFDAEGLASVRCNVTLEGSFHYRTLAKVERSLGVVPERVVHPGLLGGWELPSDPVPRRTPDETAR